MTKIIAVRHGEVIKGQVPGKEQIRVMEAVRDFAARTAINLQGSRILTPSTHRALQTSSGIAQMHSSSTSDPMRVLEDNRIFPSYLWGVGPWIASEPVNTLIHLVREKAEEIAPRQLIVVGHLPAIWALGARLDPTNFPEYQQGLYEGAEERIGYGSVFLLDLDND